MLFAGLGSFRIVKNCDRGLENGRPRAAFSRPRSQFFTIRTDPKPVNNLFIFSKLSNEKKLTEKNSRKRYCDRGQRKENPDRARLRTNHIAGFVTVPAWKKIKKKNFCPQLTGLAFNV